jgi:hypothetical protein
MAARSWSPSRTATANRAAPGRIRCATAPAATARPGAGSTRPRTCWPLPKSAHPGATAALAEIWGAEDKTHARLAAKRFADLSGAKFGKAVANVIDAAVMARSTNRTVVESHNGQPFRGRWRRMRRTSPLAKAYSP